MCFDIFNPKSEITTVFLLLILKSVLQEEGLKIRWSVYHYIRSRLPTFMDSEVASLSCFVSLSVNAEGVEKLVEFQEGWGQLV